MNLVLILRAELVCLVILTYLVYVSRSYRMGKDDIIFNRILAFSFLHVIMDTVTVCTVNHTETVPVWLNNLAHIIFFLSAILFAYEMCLYTLNLSRPKQMNHKKRLLTLLPAAVYVILLCTPLMTIEYVQLNGTKGCAGTAAAVGFTIAFAYFAVAVISILTHWNKLGKRFKQIMLPMLLILMASGVIQVLVREFLFTGCAVTAITVAFFFTLENPAEVLERKVMMDAISGLGTRSGYEHDMAEYDRDFEKDRSTPFTFVFVDISNLRSINGIYGHQEGDSCISSVAVLLMNNLRSAEHIYRMGGDEFLAVYRKTDEKTVSREIRRAQEACEKGKARFGYQPELAIGYAVSDPKYSSLRDVLRVADYMMYRHRADLKRDAGEGHLHHAGTHLNLSGLTDRMFDAMCLTSEEYYPFLTNVETGVTRVAPAMAECFGLEGEFLADFDPIWLDHIHPDDREEYLIDLSETKEGRKRYHLCRYRARTRTGEYVQVTCRGGVYHGRDGEPDVFAGYLVNHGAVGTLDVVTGLKNQQCMLDRIHEAVSAQSHGIFMRMEIRNINRIKMVYTPAAINSLLRNLADDIVQMTNGEGEVFSNNDHSFVIWMPDADENRAGALFRRIQTHAKAGVLANDELIPLGLLGGAVRLPDETMSGPGAVRQAMLFAAENAGIQSLSSLAFSDAAESGAGSGGKALLKEIQHDCAMNRSRFFLRYQPIVRAQTGEVVAVETLLRWKSDAYGEVTPGRFIAFLECDPAYEPLGYEIIRQAVRTAGRIRKKLPNLRINVNITAIQLLTDDFVSNVVNILTEERFEPSDLILELTERCKEMEFEQLSRRVKELKQAGIRVALDDMGTGYSTIDLLLHLPVNEIKLDLAFTQGLQNVEKHELLARTLCDAAAKDGVDICFEGVENAGMADYLKQYGNVLLQGYYYDKPLLAEEFEQKYCGIP